MRRLRFAIAVFAGLFTAVVPGAATGDPIPLPVGEAGFSMTISAADTFREGVPYAVSGDVYAVAALPIVLEVSKGLPGQEVEILVDGARLATATTNDEGHYVVDLQLTGEPPTHVIEAVVNRGTPAEVRSRTVLTTIDQVFTDLRVDPGTATIDLGGTTTLRAFALDGDGREVDVTTRATWTSSDDAVATVTGGSVQGIGVGTATVTATVADQTDNAAITVVDNGR